MEVCTDMTMLSSLSSLRREISRIAVLGTPSSSASSRIFLRATYWPVLMSLALYTTPYVPGRREQARRAKGGTRGGEKVSFQGRNTSLVQASGGLTFSDFFELGVVIETHENRCG